MKLKADRFMLALSKKGISQIELARRIGISRSQITHYKKGIDNPSNENLKKIADALDTTVEYLTGYEDKKVVTKISLIEIESSIEKLDLIISTFKNSTSDSIINHIFALDNYLSRDKVAKNIIEQLESSDFDSKDYYDEIGKTMTSKGLSFLLPRSLPERILSIYKTIIVLINKDKNIHFTQQNTIKDIIYRFYSDIKFILLEFKTIAKLNNGKLEKDLSTILFENNNN